MTQPSFLRRLCLLAAAVLLTSGASVLSATSSLADTPEVEITVAPSTVRPGETFTVTQKVTNVHPFSILQPKARLFGSPGTLPSYTTLESCTGPISSCTAYNEGDVGYQAVLSEAMSGNTSVTVTFTLKVKADAIGGDRLLRGRLTGSNYGSEPFDGPTLNVLTEADLSVRLTATPRLGLLVPYIQFTTTATNAGPTAALSATVTTALPPGLSANSSACTPGSGSVACSFSDLAVGESGSAQFRVPLAVLTIGIPYTFTATRTASSPADPASGNDSATVRCTVVTLLLVSCASV